MIRYTVKRLLFFLPSVFLISVLSFVLIRAIPGDMTDFLIRSQTDERTLSDSPQLFARKYRQKAHELGADLPAFYVTLDTWAEPRHLSYEWNPVRKSVVRTFIGETGNASAAEAWYNSVETLDNSLQVFGRLHPDKQSVIDAKRISDRLLYANEAAEITEALDDMRAVLSADTVYDRYTAHWLSEPERAWQTLQQTPSRWKNYLPVPRFHARCAYGLWLFGNGTDNRGVLRGDFGLSLLDKKPVSDSLGERIGLTVLLSLISVVLAFLVSVPLGVFMALHKGSVWEKAVSTLVFILYALPSFWVASLCIIWLAGGDGLDWFAPYGTGTVTADMSFWDIVVLRWKHFALPVFAWTYSGIAFITKQTQSSVADTLDKPYIRSAVARGLPFRQIIRRHVLPNSLRPLITLAAGILPGLIGGSVVLETIFSLPGLGEWAYRAFLLRDFPVIMAVVFWGSLLTLIGYLVSDLLLAATDPKIRFQAPKNA